MKYIVKFILVSMTVNLRFLMCVVFIGWFLSLVRQLLFIYIQHRSIGLIHCYANVFKWLVIFENFHFEITRQQQQQQRQQIAVIEPNRKWN